VIEEPLGGAHRDHHQMASRVKKYLSKTLEQLTKIPVDELIALRYEKFRRMGSYLEQLEDGSLEERGSIVGS
jgi:acetyl-CoA carboxylase carboxyl transferase subunit alpha